MSLIKKINDPNGKKYDDFSIGSLVLDTEPIPGSFNPVTSDGVKNAIDDSVDAAKAEMQEKIDEVTLDPSAVSLGNVHLLDEVTEFPADGCILVDSETNGPGEMSKDKLLELTAQNVVKYEMEGRNNNAVYHNFFALPYKIVIIKPSTTTWSVSNVSGNILAISSFNSSNTETSLRLFAKGSTIPGEIIICVPYDSAYMRILLRADVGASVTFSYEIIDAPALNISSENFELGNITISASSLTYSSPSGSTGTRFRTKLKQPFSLNAGDIICAKEGYEFYIAASANGEPTYTVTSGWVKRYTASSDCKVHFLLRRSPETTTTFDDLSKGFIVYSKISEILVNNVVVNDSNNFNLIDNKKLSVTFGGSGNNEWQYNVYVPKGVLLKITHDGPVNWNDSSLGSSAAKLAIRRGTNGGGTPIDMIVYRKGEDVPDIIVYVQDNIDYINLFFRANSGVVVNFNVEILNDYQLFKQAKVRGINHRGLNTIAPENTLPAFRMSAQKGFDCVETDVRTTADGHIVCIHDATVDRTSNGTGSVADMTLSQLKALDFGSWKDAAFAGTTIPTLEEFIVLCRNLGLSAYIETKDVDIEQLMNEIQGLGALDFVTIISSSITDLTYVATNYKNVRCGYVSTTFTETELSNVLALRELSINVFVDLHEQSGDSLQRIKDNHLVYEGWVFTKDRILAADPCISGFTSDDVNAKQVLFEKEYV